MAGAGDSIFAIGDCTVSSYAPTAQVTSQQGAYLARQFAQIAKKEALEAKLSAVRDHEGAVMAEESKKQVEDLTRQLEKLSFASVVIGMCFFLLFLKWNPTVRLPLQADTLARKRLLLTCPFT
jgi:NADH dehydrogenase FAD-containing subunit